MVLDETKTFRCEISLDENYEKSEAYIEIREYFEEIFVQNDPQMNVPG